MAAEAMQFSWRWNVGTISLNLGVIWEMSAQGTAILPWRDGLDRMGRSLTMTYLKRVAIVLVSIALFIGFGPAPAAADPFAYVANFFSHNVSVIDTATNTVVATVGVSIVPAGVAVTPDGAFAYVANNNNNAPSNGWQRQHIQAYRNWRHGKLVKFRSQAKDKAQITGLLYEPKGKPPFPAIMLLHGRGGAFPYQENWAYLLSKYGYVTLMVDGYCSRGLRCLRQGKIKKTRAWKKMRETEFRIGDAQAGVTYLASLAVVNKDRIGGFGFSRGGSALIDSVIQPSEIRLKALVALYPQDMRNITLNVGWSLPTIVSIPTEKHKDRKINHSRESNRAFFPRDGFNVEVLSLPNTTIKYDQPGEEVITVIGQRFHRKYNKEATLETEKRAISLFHEHLGGSLEPVK